MRPLQRLLSSDSTERPVLLRLALVGLALEIVLLVGLVLPFPLTRYSHHLYDIGSLTGHKTGAFVGFVAVMTVAFIAFYVAWRVAARATSREALWLVLGVGAALGLTLMFLYPLTATDVYGYTARSFLFVDYTANPYFVPPSEIHDTTIDWLAGSWPGLKMTYGPVWVLTSALPRLLGGHNVLANLLLYKAISLVAILAGAALVYHILSRIAPRYRVAGALLYAWNPLVLFEGVGNGHNDVFMMAFVLLGMFALVSRHALLAMVALALATLVKLPAAALLPVFLLALLLMAGAWRERIKNVALGALAFGATVVVFYAPFWGGMDTLKPVRDQNSIYIGSLPTLFRLFLEGLHLDSVSDDTIIRAVVLLFYGAFAIAYLGLAIAFLKGRGQHVTAIAFGVMTAFVLLGVTQFEVWYAVWVAALAALLIQRRLTELTIAFCLGASLSATIYAWFWNDLPYFRLNVAAVSLMLGLPALLALCYLLAWLWSRRRRTPSHIQRAPASP